MSPTPSHPLVPPAFLAIPKRSKLKIKERTIRSWKRSLAATYGWDLQSWAGKEVEVRKEQTDRQMTHIMDRRWPLPGRVLSHSIFHLGFSPSRRISGYRLLLRSLERERLAQGLLVLFCFCYGGEIPPLRHTITPLRPQVSK